jgi:hypothetical protein
MSGQETYWGTREKSIYLYTVRQLVTELASGAESLIDVGSAGCPYLSWYSWIPYRTSLDLRRPFVTVGIKSYKGDFLTWEADRDYDICTCLQVLEHVPAVAEFAEKLLITSKILVVSVPYKWKVGGNKSHIHDPVDEEKMLAWFKRKPNFSTIVREVVSDSRRLVQVYERGNHIRWTSLNKRAVQKTSKLQPEA